MKSILHPDRQLRNLAFCNGNVFPCCSNHTPACAPTHRPTCKGITCMVVIGMQDATQARCRATADDRLADLLEQAGLDHFLAHWYSTGMWSTMRKHPAFPQLISRRAGGAPQARQAARHRAAALRAMSTGRMVRRCSSACACIPHFMMFATVVIGKSGYLCLNHLYDSNRHIIKVLMLS